MITVKSEKKPDNKDTAVHLTSVVPSAAYDCDLGGRSRLARTQAPHDISRLSIRSMECQRIPGCRSTTSAGVSRLTASRSGSTHQRDVRGLHGRPRGSTPASTRPRSTDSSAPPGQRTSLARAAAHRAGPCPRGALNATLAARRRWRAPASVAHGELGRVLSCMKRRRSHEGLAFCALHSKARASEPDCNS